MADESGKKLKRRDFTATTKSSLCGEKGNKTSAEKVWFPLTFAMPTIEQLCSC
jgi:hypothetical protein